MPRRRRSEPTSVSLILSRWLSRRGLQAEIRQYEIWSRWAELVGDRIAARTEPGPLKDGRLTVRVTSAAWLNELSFMRADLAQKINAGLGEARVRDIRLVAGAKRKGEPRRIRPAAAPDQPAVDESIDEQLLAETESAAAAVQDAPLREALRRAAIARLRFKPQKN